MKLTAEALGAKSAQNFLDEGVDEVLIPCIDGLEEAVQKAARVKGPVTVHAPCNRIDDPEAAIASLLDHGIESVLLVSGNPGHGTGTLELHELIALFRRRGLHVSVGAYPEDYFTSTSPAHRSRDASILAEKQEAGAQRVITQASFKTDNLRKWLHTVRSQGVVVPIQIGVMVPVPRHVWAGVAKSTRAEIFSHPRAQLANKPNLDLIFRMVCSEAPKPAKFIEAVDAMKGMGPKDGFHVYAYGRNIRPLVRAARAIDEEAVAAERGAAG